MSGLNYAWFQPKEAEPASIQVLAHHYVTRLRALVSALALNKVLTIANHVIHMSKSGSILHRLVPLFSYFLLFTPPALQPYQEL
jgi:hypothetical protein